MVLIFFIFFMFVLVVLLGSCCTLVLFFQAQERIKFFDTISYFDFIIFLLNTSQNSQYLLEGIPKKFASSVEPLSFSIHFLKFALIQFLQLLTYASVSCCVLLQLLLQIDLHQQLNNSKTFSILFSVMISSVLSPLFLRLSLLLHIYLMLTRRCFSVVISWCRIRILESRLVFSVIILYQRFLHPRCFAGIL